ncbi:MAG: hypothetical protein JW880_03585 [Candidatus Thermoplasmatota archaeon]|nr:hypothetical protein [Candidatus Thermoplasmatota archaeon]
MAVDSVPSFDNRLDSADDLADIFEIVKLAVRKTTGKERAGLMLGLADLGGGPQGFVGAFYPVATNIIVMNSLPLRRIRETEPVLYKPYVFHILLHEYLHTLGIIDESATRQKAFEISMKLFGENHPVTHLAADLSKFIPKLVYPVYGWQAREDYTLELVEGFDRSSTSNYIN